MIDYLVDVTVHNGTNITTLHYSGTGVNYSGNYYEPRLKNPGSLKLMMFSDGTTRGQSKIGFGEVQLVNNDGGLDALIDYGFDGRTIMIREIILATGLIGLTLSCSMEQPVWTEKEMSIRIKDPQIAFNVPLQTNKYAGTNALPNGIEGTADIQGKPKPLAYGEVHNATPVLVNTSKLIYQANDGVLQAVSAVYDKGVALTAGVDRADTIALEANIPSPGTYDTCLAEGLFRLGSSAFGAVTCDVLQGATAADRTAAQIGKQIALRTSPVIGYVTQDFVDLDAANSAVVGYYASAETTIATALDEVIGSIGGWYGFDSAGLMNVGRLDAPSGTSVATLTDDEIVQIQRLATQDEGRGLPVWKVNLNYDKNNTVQSADSLAGITNIHWETTATYTTVLTKPPPSIAYGNGLFVAFGLNSFSCLTSPDGVTWTQRIIPNDLVWSHVVYGNGLFVVVGMKAGMYGYSACATSPDGITWTRRTLPGTNLGAIIAYGNGVFVTFGSSSNFCATSPDGITWTQRMLPVTGEWYSVVYGNGLFMVIAGNNSDICLTSPDGITWTQRALPSVGYWSNAVYGNGAFVVADDHYPTKSATSSDGGVTWTQRTFLDGVGWGDIIYGNGVFVLSNAGISAISIDGIIWQQITIPNITLSQHAIAYGNGQFVAVRNANYTLSIESLVLNLSSDLLRYVTTQHRTTTVSDSTILTVHPLATEITIDTLLISGTAAAIEATRQLDLRKVRRDYLAVTVPRSALSTIPDLGRMITVKYPRYGYAAGKLLVLIGYDVNLSTDSLTLYLWG